MKIILTARERQGMDESYKVLEKQGLQTVINLISGIGTLQDPFVTRISIRNQCQKDWEGVIHVELSFQKNNPRFFLPGFMYGRNRGEAPLNVDNEFPRLREGALHRPAAPWWMVRSDRLSHPAAFVYDEGKIYGLCASPYFIQHEGRKEQWSPGAEGEFYQYAGYTCSLQNGCIGYTLGYENAPWLYIQSHKVEERKSLGNNCFRITVGEEISFEIQHYCYGAECERDIYEAVQGVYEHYHEQPRRVGDIHTAVSEIASAVSEDAWIEKDRSYSGFVFEESDGSRKFQKIYSLSWTNGLSVAVPVLMSSLRLKDEVMREQALCCIENMVQNCLSPHTGLPYGAYDNGIWSNQGWWFDGMHNPGHSGYLTGQAVYYLLKAYDYEMQIRNVIHGDWLEFAKDIIDKLEKTKNIDFEYPYILSERTGSGLEYDSMGSAWCLTATAYYSWLKKDFSYLDGLRRSESHYYETFVRKSECYGGPLDTDKTVDSEGILSYIRALRWLHQITGEEVYLNHLRDALSYEYTFKFCYNSPIQTPPLGRLGWSSCGGSITSVANPHIHPMSSTVIDEMLYYLTQREDGYIRSRLNDTIMWSCQTYNRYDKEYDYGRKGWMSERFCHCEGLLVQKYPDGQPASTWFALMGWACGSILEGLSGDCWDYADERL